MSVYHLSLNRPEFANIGFGILARDGLWASSWGRLLSLLDLYAFAAYGSKRSLASRQVGL